MSDRAWLGWGIVITVVALGLALFCTHLADVAYQHHAIGHAAAYGAMAVVCDVCFFVSARAVGDWI